MSTSKLLTIGAAALIAIGVGGFGAKSFMERKVVGEIEERFASLRTAFAKADHGPIIVDLWHRKVEISQISLVPKDATADTAITVASVTAFGSNSAGESVTADRLEIRDLSVNVAMFSEVGARVKYEAPMIAIENFAMRRTTPANTSDPIAAIIPLVAAVSAKEISVPLMKSSTTMLAPNKTPASPFDGGIDQTQYNVRIDNFTGGRIGKATVERMTMAAKLRPPANGNFGLEAREGFATDYDLVGLLTAFAGDASIKRSPGSTTLWRTAGIGPMSIKVGNQVGVAIGGATMDAVTVDATKLRPAWLAFKASQPDMVRPTPAQQQAFANAMADVYESISFGKIEYRGMTVDGAGMPPWKLDRFALDDYQAGTLGTLTLSGLDGAMPGPKKEVIHLGRFALNGMKLSQLLRLSGQANPAMGPAQLNRLYSQFLGALTGIEISDLLIPEPKSGQKIKIDTANMSWGAFVGEMPSAGQFAFKASIPTAGNAQEPLATLARAGVPEADFKYDGRWQWLEPAQTLTHATSFNLAGVAAASIKLDLGNVSRLVFIAGPVGFSNFAQDMRLGPISISLRDLGLFKLMATDAVLNVQRQQMLHSLRATSASLPPEQEMMRSIVNGAIEFLDNPNGLLTLDFVPKAQVNLGQLTAAGQTGPEVMQFLASQFDVRVTAGAAP